MLDRIAQASKGVAQISSGILMVIGGSGASPGTGGLSLLLIPAGIGSMTFGYTNIVEAALNPDEQLLPNSGGIPGVITETMTKSKAAGAFVDLAFGLYGSPASTLSDIKTITEATDATLITLEEFCPVE